MDSAPDDPEKYSKELFNNFPQGLFLTPPPPEKSKYALEFIETRDGSVVAMPRSDVPAPPVPVNPPRSGPLVNTLCSGQLAPKIPARPRYLDNSSFAGNLALPPPPRPALPDNSSFAGQLALPPPPRPEFLDNSSFTPIGGNTFPSSTGETSNAANTLTSTFDNLNHQTSGDPAEKDPTDEWTIFEDSRLNTTSVEAHIDSTLESTPTSTDSTPTSTESTPAPTESAPTLTNNEAQSCDSRQVSSEDYPALANFLVDIKHVAPTVNAPWYGLVEKAKADAIIMVANAILLQQYCYLIFKVSGIGFYHRATLFWGSVDLESLAESYKQLLLDLSEQKVSHDAVLRETRELCIDWVQRYDRADMEKKKTRKRLKANVKVMENFCKKACKMSTNNDTSLVDGQKFWNKVVAKKMTKNLRTMVLSLNPVTPVEIHNLFKKLYAFKKSS